MSKRQPGAPGGFLGPPAVEPDGDPAEWLLTYELEVAKQIVAVETYVEETTEAVLARVAAEDLMTNAAVVQAGEQVVAVLKREGDELVKADLKSAVPEGLSFEKAWEQVAELGFRDQIFTKVRNTASWKPTSLAARRAVEAIMVHLGSKELNWLGFHVYLTLNRRKDRPTAALGGSQSVSCWAFGAPMW